MTLRPYIGYLAFAVALIASAGSANANPILKRIEAFTAAYNAKDANAVAEFYTEKGALLPPRSAPLVGRRNIADHYQRAFKNGVGNLRYKVVEIDQVGPNAVIEIGETLVKLGENTIRGRSIHVWKNVDGNWSLARDMYHVLSVAK